MKKVNLQSSLSKFIKYWYKIYWYWIYSWLISKKKQQQWVVSVIDLCKRKLETFQDKELLMRHWTNIKYLQWGACFHSVLKASLWLWDEEQQSKICSFAWNFFVHMRFLCHEYLLHIPFFPLHFRGSDIKNIRQGISSYIIINYFNIPWHRKIMYFFNSVI